MITKSSFKPAWWLRQPHAQTIFASQFRSLKPPIDKLERIELPDGDFIDLAWSNQGLSPDSPLVILLHGLGGGLNSSYVAAQLHEYRRRGWRGVLMHFRGGSGEPNRLCKTYHSGSTGELDYVLNHLADREPDSPKALVGVSMGGNILLKYLGETGKQDLVKAAVAVSVPFQLSAASDRMNAGFSKIYQFHLLKKLYRIIERKYAQYPEVMPFPLEDVLGCRTFWDFDERVTARLNGFTSAEDYYQQSSSRQYLISIQTPTLIIHAEDDPFMTKEVIPGNEELSPEVMLELSQHGGHVGFVAGQVPGKPVYWLDQRISEFLETFFSI